MEAQGRRVPTRYFWFHVKADILAPLSFPMEVYDKFDRNCTGLVTRRGIYRYIHKISINNWHHGGSQSEQRDGLLHQQLCSTAHASYRAFELPCNIIYSTISARSAQ